MELRSVVGDDVVVVDDARCTLATVDAVDPLFAVSFGYRHIVPADVVDRLRGRIVNLHISLLPWNRGADPNFWSWFTGTPKGVTVHWLTAGLDRGDIVAQEQIEMDDGHTLRTSYDLLHRQMLSLFERTWPALRGGSVDATPQSGDGSYHRAADKEAYPDAMPLGWDTDCAHVAALGRRLGLWVAQPG